MSGFASIIKNAVTLANTLTSTLQDSVGLIRWIEDNSDNEPQYADRIDVPAVVEFKQRLVRGPGGKEINQTAIVTFVRPIPDQGAAERREPVDPRDQIVLPSGYIGSIIDVQGVVNPETHSPYMLQVFLA